MGADDGKTPEQIRREARQKLAELKAERKAAALLREAQRRAEAARQACEPYPE